MATDSDKSNESVEDYRVPEELLQKLHEADQRFHDAKRQLETVMSDSEFSHQKRIEEAEDQLRQAERELEKVTTEIHGALKTPPEANH